MKQQLKRAPYFVAGLFLFVGCQTEEIPFTECEQQDIRKVTKVSFTTFKNLTGLTDFKTTFVLPKNNNGLVARRSSSCYVPNDFIIDTDQITQTVVDGKTSYSFPITPKEGEKEDSRFYLVVYDKEGSWLDMVIESDFSKDAFGNPNETRYREIYASAARGTGCTTIFTWVIKCNRKGRCSTGICDRCSICLKTDSERICGKDDGGYGDDAGKPLEPIEGGGGSSNIKPGLTKGEVVVTLPSPGNTDTPCRQLKSLLEPDPDNKQLVPNIKPQILWLQELVNEKVEYGVEIKKGVNFNGDMVYTPTQVESESSSEVTLNTGNRMMGWLHSHPKSGFGMFSFQDLKFLKEAYEETSEDNKAEIFTIMVCRDKTDPTKINTYAIKIDDIAALGAKIDAIWNNPDYFSVSEKEKIDAIHFNQGKKYHSYEDELEFSFLMQFTDSGISLYKADEQLTTWTKLELEPDAGYSPPFKVKQTSCN